VSAPSARVKALIAWANETNHRTSGEYINAERETASQLGLELADGRWEEEPRYDDGHEPEFMVLTAVHHLGALIGFIGTGRPGMRLVFYEQPRLA